MADTRLTEEQLAALEQRYAVWVPPRCPVCARDLTCTDTGSPWRGVGARYACPGAMEDPRPGTAVREAVEHYQASQVSAPSNQGDAQVLALVAEVRRLRRELHREHLAAAATASGEPRYGR
jgi:hypothetical protein